MRSGLRIRGHRGQPEVRGALIKFARWLRTNHEFPIRVPVYLLPGQKLVMANGAGASASFFSPRRRTEEPYIRIATGDYPALKREQGRDNALAAFIVSMSHEIVHYEQWVRAGRITERGVATRAVRMLRRYEATTRRP